MLTVGHWHRIKGIARCICLFIQHLPPFVVSCFNPCYRLVVPTCLPSHAYFEGMRLLEGLRSGRESLREVVAALEADVEAMYELIDRYDGERSATQGNNSAESEQQATNAVSTESLFITENAQVKKLTDSQRKLEYFLEMTSPENLPGNWRWSNLAGTWTWLNLPGTWRWLNLPGTWRVVV